MLVLLIFKVWIGKIVNSKQKAVNRKQRICGRAEIGIQACLRSMWAQARVGSSPIVRIIFWSPSSMARALGLSTLLNNGRLTQW